MRNVAQQQQQQQQVKRKIVPEAIVEQAKRARVEQEKAANPLPSDFFAATAKTTTANGKQKTLDIDVMSKSTFAQPGFTSI
jgi:hypothetical protein